LVLVAILLGCEGSVNQLDVLGFVPERGRSRGKKGLPTVDFLHRCAVVRQCFGLGYEVFGRAYRVLLQAAALLYGDVIRAAIKELRDVGGDR
jgi:hypothetical protein